MFQEKQLKYQDLLTTDNLQATDVNFFILPSTVEFCLASFRMPAFHWRTSKLLESSFCLGPPRLSPTQRLKQDAILPLEYFTLGRSITDNYWDVFLSHNEGNFNVFTILNICDGDLHHPFGRLPLSLAPLLQPVWQGQLYQSLHTWQHSSHDHKEALSTCQDHIIPVEGDKYHISQTIRHNIFPKNVT